MDNDTAVDISKVESINFSGSDYEVSNLGLLAGPGHSGEDSNPVLMSQETAIGKWLGQQYQLYATSSDLYPGGGV